MGLEWIGFGVLLSLSWTHGYLTALNKPDSQVPGAKENSVDLSELLRNRLD